MNDYTLRVLAANKLTERREKKETIDTRAREAFPHVQRNGNRRTERREKQTHVRVCFGLGFRKNASHNGERSARCVTAERRSTLCQTRAKCAERFMRSRKLAEGKKKKERKRGREGRIYGTKGEGRKR